MRRVIKHLHFWFLLLITGTTLNVIVSGIPSFPDMSERVISDASKDCQPVNQEETVFLFPEGMDPEGDNYAIRLPGASTNAGGANSNVTLPPFNITSLPVTIELWYKPDHDAPSTYYATLFYSRGTPDGNPNVGIQYDRWVDTEKIKAVWNGSAQIPEVKPLPGEWNHVVLVMTSTSKVFYINGVPFTESGTSYTNYPFSENTYLGWDNIYWTTVGDARTLKGEVDEVRIWTTERTAQELEDNKYLALNGDENGLLGYWNFDDQVEGVATDLTGNGFNGTINGGTYVLSTLFDLMKYMGSDVSQKQGYVNTNSANNVVMVLEIETKNISEPLHLTNLRLSTTGTTNISDISDVRVYATGKDDVFSTENPVAQLGGSPDQEDFQLACNYELVPGKNYFRITYDVSKNATRGNILDIVCNSFDLKGVVTTIHEPATPSPAGYLVIFPDLFINNLKLPVDALTTQAATSIEGANFASFQQNAIMTYNGYQYVAYWNNVVHLCLARRKLPVGEWEVLEFTDYTLSRSRVADNHYSISMGICENDGTIHLSYDHHNDDLNYRVSVDSLANKPDEISWTMESFGSTIDYLEQDIKVANVTYPRFISKPDGDLIFECRIGWSGDGDSFLWEYSAETGAWEYIGEYLNGTKVGENAYINGLHYDPSGRMHTSWVWRQTPDARTNHDVCYGYSDDDGRTWYNAEGVKVGTAKTNPLTLNTTGLKVWTVNTYRGLINQESQAVDSKGGVHILQSYILENEPNNYDFWGSRINLGYLRHIYRDESGMWHSDVIAPSTRNRSEIAVDANDNLFVVAPEYRIYFASAADNWATWTEFDISESKSAINEGLIDREALLNEDVLSFVFAHSDNDGKIIVPYYLLDKSRPGTGEGLQIVVYKDAEWQDPVSQKLDVADIKTEDVPVTVDDVSILCKGILETVFAEQYTLYLTTSGNTKMWINEKLVLDSDNIGTETEFSFHLELVPSHKNRIRIEGVYSASSVITKLEWSCESQERELVPLTELYGKLEDLPVDVNTERISPEHSFNFYPNPFKSTFILEVQGLFGFKIFDLHGKEVERGNGKDYCELGGGLKSGIYLIKVMQNSQHTAARFIKH